MMCHDVFAKMNSRTAASAVRAEAGFVCAAVMSAVMSIICLSGAALAASIIICISIFGLCAALIVIGLISRIMLHSERKRRRLY